MTTKAQLEQAVNELTDQLRKANERVARAESNRPEMSNVVGYYILHEDLNHALWDGVLHSTLASADASFGDLLTREVESAAGWGIYECRRLLHTPENGDNR